ncbi:MAG: YXWGXW repeat-containing protein [Planctomycetaceae bacterium]|nr:YXWGXW repeat-containing protein [Planctomycetaceae bacterium]
MPCFKTFHWPGVVSGCLAVTLAGGLSSSRVCAQDDTSRDQVETPLNDLPQTDERISDDIEVDAVEPLDRGPIHEAFAEPVVLDTEETIVVPKEPPETIDELPPEVKSDGTNVLWVPGYWHWLDDEEDFVWVSGLWRDAPPRQQWIPGYWSEVEGGYQWTAGFWTAADELSYLPEPPQSLEAGPTSPAPGETSFWVPGCWEWQTTDYSWRPGYWSVGHDNWLWVPSRCVYTPRGYVFLNGYWDYPFQRRGLLFAPVRYRRPIYRRAGYVFTPRQWINVDLLTRGLFVSPRYRHYYFGNYYGAGYASRGFYPWYGYHNRRFGYDPLFAYTSWQRGQSNRGWIRDLQNDYRRFDGPGGQNRDRIPGNDIVDRDGQGRPNGDDRPNGERVAGQEGPPNGNGRASRDQSVFDQDGGPRQGDQDRDGRPQFVRQMNELATRSRDQRPGGPNSDNRVADTQVSQFRRLSENERQQVREQTTNELSDLRRRREQSESQLRSNLDGSNVGSNRNTQPRENQNGGPNVSDVQRETLRPVQGANERGNSARQSLGRFELPQRTPPQQSNPSEQPRLRSSSNKAPQQGRQLNAPQQRQIPEGANGSRSRGQLQVPQQGRQVNVPPRPQSPAGANRAQPRGQLQAPQQGDRSFAPSNRGGVSPAFNGRGSGNRGGGSGNRGGGSGNGGRGGGGRSR